MRPNNSGSLLSSRGVSSTRRDAGYVTPPIAWLRNERRLKDAISAYDFGRYGLFPPISSATSDEPAPPDCRMRFGAHGVVYFNCIGNCEASPAARMALRASTAEA